MSDNERKLENYLKEHGHSVTKVRRVVFEALQGPEPITMAKLISKLPNIDRASVYRTVALFEELNIAKRIQFGWKYKLELSEAFNYHHHHISCTACGLIVSLHENTGIESAIQAWASEYGFSPSDHQLEIQGLCGKCRNKMTSAV